MKRKWFEYIGFNGRAWNPTSIDGLGDWDVSYRAEPSPSARVRIPRGRPLAALPLAARLANVQAELDELERVLPDLNDLQ